MGDDGVTSPGQSGEDDESSPLSYSDFIYEQFPYYYSWGVSAEEYWDGDYELLPLYRKAHEMKLEYDNYLSWIQGLYIYHASADVAPMYNSLKPSRPSEYLSEPIPITKEAIERKKKKEAELEWAKIRAMVANSARVLDNQKKNIGGEKDAGCITEH